MTLLKSISYRHYFNHIEYTKWPFYISIWTGFLIYFFIIYLNKYISINYVVLLIIFVCLFIQIENWSKDMVIESTFLGRYNKKIYSTLLIGFFLFLTSEVMLFSGFFWSYFDRIFFLSSYIDNITKLSVPSHPWLPIDWYRLPFIGTLFLINSGYLCNIGYYTQRMGFRDASYFWLCGSIGSGLLFLCLQELEYLELAVTISDGISPSLFYLLTGFHGMHVIVGLLLIVTQSDRSWNNELPSQRASGLSYAVIYWHFVDIIWIFLYIFVYVLNNTKVLSIESSSLINDDLFTKNDDLGYSFIYLKR